MENLTKSEAAWMRFRARTNGGAAARRASMEHRPSVIKARRERALRTAVATDQPRYFKRVAGKYVQV